MLSRARLHWLSTLPQDCQDTSQDIFWFFLKDEEFVSKTINDSNIDLDKVPGSKVRQLAKKMESSKATARHIKQVASAPRWHKLILCDTSMQIKKKKSFVKPRPASHKNIASDRQPVFLCHNNNYKKSYGVKNMYKNKERCQKCGDSTHIEGFQCPAKKYQCKSCHKFLFSKGKQRPICCKWELCMLVTSLYVATQKIFHLAVSLPVYK